MKFGERRYWGKEGGRGLRERMGERMGKGIEESIGGE